MRRLFVFTIILLCFWLKTTHVQASNEFTSSLTSTYIVDTNGTTHVTQQFSLKNNFSSIYITEYALEVGSNRLSNVHVDANGVGLEPTITPHGNKTGIAFTFKDKIIGKDQERKFSVSYTTEDIAVRTGDILEVNIPKLANAGEFSTYIVNMSVDSSLGSPALTSPSTFTSSIDQGKTTITFINVGQQQGISVIFGKQQIANLSLAYHIENPTSQKGLLAIALPPDTLHQRMYYTSFSPEPIDITTDADGNWLASYELEPNQKETIRVNGTAVVQLASSTEKLKSNQKPDKEYLNSTTYWQVSNPTIQQLSKQLKTPEAIYDYVVKTLSYDYTRLSGANKRLGAIESLKNPANSVCTEFTDLFITLARAAGIPAREVNGYAYTQNDTLRPLSLLRDVLHAWPEYWDETKQEWIGVDPTWGSTTGGDDYFSHLDFNHIVFAIHGKNAEQPLAAGLYKLPGDEQKDIALAFVSQIPQVSNTVSAQVSVRTLSMFSAASPYTIHVVNHSLHALYEIPYVLRTVLPNGQTGIQNGLLSLLPLESSDISLHLPSESLFTNRDITIEAQINSQVFTDHINVESYVSEHKNLIFLLLAVGGSALIIAFITRRLLVPRWKR